jgi:hypothetical protein
MLKKVYSTDISNFVPITGVSSPNRPEASGGFEAVPPGGQPHVAGV